MTASAPSARANRLKDTTSSRTVDPVPTIKGTRWFITCTAVLISVFFSSMGKAKNSPIEPSVRMPSTLPLIRNSYNAAVPSVSI